MIRFLWVTCIFFSLQQTDIRLSWNDKADFDWGDFKGYPNTDSPYAANVNTGISHSYELDPNGKLVPGSSEVTAYFYPKLSWCKPDRVNDNLLKHERLHFTISELHARIFKDRIAAFAFTENSQSEIRELYQKVELERQQMQRLFDEQSQHGLHPEGERFWQEKVRRLLAKY